MGIQTVSVMFTDLVDSTATMYRLGEAAADALRREHDEMLRGEIGVERWTDREAPR
ncbi:MAG: hypothetical protein M5U19_08080 [Microthrixaceae bacterium]|nr:hypothetical protein [Microthrixaceae bacterium]